MNENIKNFGQLKKEDIEAVKKHENIGKDEPSLPENISEYTKEDFAELFGKENIDQELKIYLIKKLEKQIENLKKELTKLKKYRDQLIHDGNIDELLLNCNIDIIEKDHAIKIRQIIIDVHKKYN